MALRGDGSILSWESLSGANDGDGFELKKTPQNRARPARRLERDEWGRRDITGGNTTCYRAIYG